MMILQPAGKGICPMKRLLWMMLTVLLLLSSCALAEDGDDVEAVNVIM